MLIAGPNLTIDRTLEIDSIRPGEVLRFTRADITPGGKGVNVARTARRLGVHAHLIALVPGLTGRAVAGLIADEGLNFSGVPVGGEIRSCAIVKEVAGRVTVFNEPGPPVQRDEWDTYEVLVAEGLDRHRLLACVGSTPPGAPGDSYARLIGRAHEASVATLVDAGGGLLDAALAAHPDYVAPNLGEAEALLRGRATEKIDTNLAGVEERALEAAAALVERGARTAIVTAGRAGVAAAGAGVAGRGGDIQADTGDGLWMDAPKVAVVNPIGAGDSFVAGFCGAIERGTGIVGALERAVATAAASVEHPLAGGVDTSRIRDLTPGRTVGKGGRGRS